MPNKNNYLSSADWRKKNVARNSRTRNTSQSPGNRDRSTSSARCNVSSRTSGLLPRQQSAVQGKAGPSSGSGGRSRQTSVTRKQSSAQGIKASPSRSPSSGRKRAGVIVGGHDPRVPGSTVFPVTATPKFGATDCRMSNFFTQSTNQKNQYSNNCSLATAGQQSTLEAEAGVGRWGAPTGALNASFHSNSPRHRPASSSLGEQRAILAATRTVWAIADTAEQVANMSPRNLSITNVASTSAGPFTAQDHTAATSSHTSGAVSRSAANPVYTRITQETISTSLINSTRDESAVASRLNSEQSTRPVSRLSQACPPTRSDSTPPY